jgi:hypothetical protein
VGMKKKMMMMRKSFASARLCCSLTPSLHHSITPSLHHSAPARLDFPPPRPTLASLF